MPWGNPAAAEASPKWALPEYTRNPLGAGSLHRIRTGQLDREPLDWQQTVFYDLDLLSAHALKQALTSHLAALKRHPGTSGEFLDLFGGFMTFMSQTCEQREMSQP